MSAADSRPVSSDTATNNVNIPVNAHAHLPTLTPPPIPKAVLTETKHAVTTIRRLTSTKLKAEYGLAKLSDMNRPTPKSLRINNKSSFSSFVDPQVKQDFEKAKDDAATALRNNLIAAKQSEVSAIQDSIIFTTHTMTTTLFTMAAAIPEDKSCRLCANIITVPDTDVNIFRAKKRIRANTLQADATPPSVAGPSNAQPAPMDINAINNGTLDLSTLSPHQLMLLDQWTEHFHLARQAAINDVITQNVKAIADKKAKEEKFRLAKEAEERMSVAEKLDLLIDRKIKKAMQSSKPKPTRGRSTSSKPKPKPKPKQKQKPKSKAKQPSRSNSRRRRPDSKHPNARGAGSAPKRNARSTSHAKGQGKNVRF